VSFMISPMAILHPKKTTHRRSGEQQENMDYIPVIGL
jgi:hypothetical protein